MGDIYTAQTHSFMWSIGGGYLKIKLSYTPPLLAKFAEQTVSAANNERSESGSAAVSQER